MNLGRHQLLQWVNDLVEAEYPSIESLCDGVAYCQIFEAVHPGSININRITLVTRLPLDCLKNLKILESALKNMKITMTVSIQKMANGRFQDNIVFTQWMYAHALKFGRQNIPQYRAYERRLQILEKQGRNWDEVNMHLLPNEAYRVHEQYSQHPEQEPDQEPESQLDERIEEISNYIVGLESDLKEKMQFNWRTMHMIGRSIDERSTLYGLLEQIEKLALGAPESPVQKEILRIIYESPEGFKNARS